MAINKKMSDIKKRFQLAKQDRSQYENYIDTAFRYSIPQRRIYLEAQNKLRPNPEVYDSTAILGTQRFATKLQSMLVPTAQPWMAYTNGTDTAEGEDADARKLELDKDSKIFHNELKHSNFDTQVAEAFQDLSITTGALLVNPAPAGSISAVTFKAVPISELYLENPMDGQVRTAFREHEMRLDSVTSMYVGAKLSDKQEKTLEKDPNAKVTIVESVVYKQLEDMYEISILDMKEDYYFLELTDETSPWVIFRENVVPDSALGFGRVMRVLPDIKMVNKVKELMVKGGSIAVSGTFMAHDDGVLNPYNVRLRAGGIIPVNSNDRTNPSIARLDTPTNFDWGTMEIQSLQATINDVLLSNPYGSIEQTPVRSATEITARNSDLFDSVSSSFGRLQTEFVSPVIKRVTAILQKAGRLREDLVLDGRDVSYDFVSPLTRLQKSAEIENVIEWLSVVGTMGEEITQLTVKMEDVPRWLGEKYNVPQELMRSKEETTEAGEASVEAQLPPTDPMAGGGAGAGGAGGGLAGGVMPQETTGGNVGGLEGIY